MVKVSAVQMRINDGSIDKNVERIVKSLRASSGSDIVCFPETSLTGLLRPGHKVVEESIAQIGAVSRELGTWSIFGGYARRGSKTFNELYVLNSSGELIRTYQKKNTWRTEKFVTAGSGPNAPIVTDFGKIGVINCWDIAFPDEARKLARGGAEIIFCPSYWDQKRTPNKTDYFGLVEATAFLIQAYVVFCDAWAPNETTGRSRIVSPELVLTKAKIQEIITAEVDLKKLVELRKRYNCWK
jgi:predicted amidohydrolase